MNKTLLITGATGHLGTAVCQKLLNEGNRVIGTVVPGHHRPENGVKFYECDLTEEASVQETFAQLRKVYTQLDAAILLTGGFAMGNIRETAGNDMLDMIRLNYLTAYHTAQGAINWMNEQNGGHLIFVGAKPALEGGAAAMLPYAISKNAVIKLAEIINTDRENHNIRASVIIPSVIDTPPNRKAMPDARFTDWVTPKAIAEHISFLISDTATPLRNTIFKLYNNA